MSVMLTGIAKAMEDQKRLADFELGGLIYQAATEFGENRLKANYRHGEVLLELEILRSVMRDYYQKKLMPLDVFSLDQRMNDVLSKLTLIIMDSYFKEYVNEIKQFTHYDNISGLIDINTFRRTLQKEIERAKRFKKNCSIVLLEIDDFERYRKMLNRASTNKVIDIISSEITRLTRSMDYPAKYSTNRFAVILPETSLEEARIVAERLRKSIKQEMAHEVRIRTIIKHAHSVSAGIATYSQISNTVEKMENAALALLAQASTYGNIVVA
jgi:diguanylate cyclase (GGDEF)-like protein